MTHRQVSLVATGYRRALLTALCVLAIACGDSSNNPMTPTSTPTPTPHLLSTYSNGPIAPGNVGFSAFTITGPNAGPVSATLDWTFAADSFQVQWFTGNCITGSCAPVTTQTGTTSKPYTATGPNVPAGGGTYTFGYGNTGSQTESVSVAVYQTY